MDKNCLRKNYDLRDTEKKREMKDTAEHHKLDERDMCLKDAIVMF